MKRKQKAFCPLNEIVNPDICCLSQTLAWNAWQVGLCYNDKLIHIILWSWPEFFFYINFQELHFENQNSLKCLQFLTTQQRPLTLPRVSTSKKRMGGEILELWQLREKKPMLGAILRAWSEPNRRGLSCWLEASAQCRDSLSPSFSLALSTCHVTCQKQMKIERIRLKIELNSISQPNSEGAFGNTVQYS